MSVTFEQTGSLKCTPIIDKKSTMIFFRQWDLCFHFLYPLNLLSPPFLSDFVCMLKYLECCNYLFKQQPTYSSVFKLLFAWTQLPIVWWYCFPSSDKQHAVTADLDSQSKNRVKWPFKCEWLLNTVHVTIEMNIWHHKILVFKGSRLLKTGDH